MRWFAAVGGSVRWALRPDPLGCAFTDGGESTSLIVAGVRGRQVGTAYLRRSHAQRRALPANFARGAKRGHCPFLGVFSLRSHSAGIEGEKMRRRTSYQV